MAAVSVIIAAYGRPVALDRAVRSALRQSYGDLEVLVVCDHVDSAFLSEIARDDARVRVLNLDRRAGAQYGPNSVGLRHASGATVAFLNHDDLWAEDHLSVSLDAMRGAAADFHLGVAATIMPPARSVATTVLGAAPEARLRFSYLNGPFSPWRTAHQSFNVFEPASAWLVSAAAARRIGPWAPPRAGRLNSATQWIARAHRLGIPFSTGSGPTVAKVNLHHGHAGPVYAMESAEHRLLERLLDLTGDEFRSEVTASLAERPLWRRVARRAKLSRGQLAGRMRFSAYLHTGDDRWLSASAPREPGPRRMRHSGGPRYSDRTGEARFPHPPCSDLTATEIPAAGAG